MNPADLKLPNGIPCISVDEKERRISIIVPDGYEVMAITPDSGQELTSSAHAAGGRTYPSARILRVVRREAPPTVTPAHAAGEKA
jgi:hypothetical protein